MRNLAVMLQGMLPELIDGRVLFCSFEVVQGPCFHDVVGYDSGT